MKNIITFLLLLFISFGVYAEVENAEDECIQDKFYTNAAEVIIAQNCLKNHIAILDKAVKDHQPISDTLKTKYKSLIGAEADCKKHEEYYDKATGYKKEYYKTVVDVCYKFLKLRREDLKSFKVEFEQAKNELEKIAILRFALVSKSQMLDKNLDLYKK